MRRWKLVREGQNRLRLVRGIGVITGESLEEDRYDNYEKS